MINEVLDALGLRDVTLVGNDTGGAICQLLLADDATRIGRLVLTNCDAFENFPPKEFVPLFQVAKRPLLTKVMLTPTRLRAIRHDIARFARALDRKALVDIAPSLHAFAGPTRIVWGSADRCFTVATAHRLADAFADSRLVEVPEVTTFVSIDAPEAVSAAIFDLAVDASRT